MPINKGMDKDVGYIYIGEGNGNPLQYSCLESPMDGGAWWAAVHGVTRSWTQLSDFTSTYHFHALEKEMATHSVFLPGEYIYNDGILLSHKIEWYNVICSNMNEPRDSHTNEVSQKEKHKCHVISFTGGI